MGRVWKVQKSAGWTDQNITLNIKGSGINNYLLISSDAGFAIIAQELQLDANGSITISSNLLTDGIYFTVGGNIKGPGCVTSGIALWLRADDGSATGAQWNDFSGTGNIATQTNPTFQATVLPSGMNFNPAMKFDGINDFLTTSSLFTGTGINNAQIYVVSTTDAIRGSLFGEMSSNGYQVHSHVPYSDGNLYFDAPYGYRVYAAWGGQLGTPYLWTFLRSSAGMSANRNRTLVASSVAALNNVPGANSPFHVGSSHGGGGGAINGKIAEMIVYNNASAITTTQRQQIESYLAIKYGLTLSPASPVDYLAGNGTTKIWDITANSGYYNNITGIGRDSCTGLNQKQSISVDAGYVTLALGNSIAASNAANNNTITANNSFLVIGNNTGAKLFTTTVTGLTGVNVALARTWKVQKQIGSTRILLCAQILHYLFRNLLLLVPMLRLVPAIWHYQ